VPEVQVGKRPLLLAVGAGLLYYLGFSPLSWWPLTFVGVWLLIGLLESTDSPKDAAARAMLWKTVALMPTVPYLSGLGISVHVVAVGAHVLCWGLMAAAFVGARRRFGPFRGKPGLTCPPAAESLRITSTLELHGEDR